jgi:hypothetical protein
MFHTVKTTKKDQREIPAPTSCYECLYLVRGLEDLICMRNNAGSLILPRVARKVPEWCLFSLTLREKRLQDEESVPDPVEDDEC